VDAQFNVRPYLILFSSLHSYLSNHIDAFFAFFYWSDLFYTFSYIYHSLTLHAAILVCLEHSFWTAQQGSNLNDGFTKAWNNYLKIQYALVDQEVNDYLRSKNSNDWFTMKYCPSEEECVECRKIILNNLLCKFSLCFI